MYTRRTASTRRVFLISFPPMYWVKAILPSSMRTRSSRLPSTFFFRGRKYSSAANPASRSVKASATQKLPPVHAAATVTPAKSSASAASHLA